MAFATVNSDIRHALSDYVLDKNPCKDPALALGEDWWRNYYPIVQNPPPFECSMRMDWVSLSLPTPGIYPWSDFKGIQSLPAKANPRLINYRDVVRNTNLVELARLGEVELKGKPYWKWVSKDTRKLIGHTYKFSIKLGGRRCGGFLFEPADPNRYITIRLNHPHRKLLEEIGDHLFWEHRVTRVEFTFHLITKCPELLFVMMALTAHKKWAPRPLTIWFNGIRYIGNPRYRYLMKAIRFYIRDGWCHFEVICGRRWLKRNCNVYVAKDLIDVDPMVVLNDVHFGAVNIDPVFSDIIESEESYARLPSDHGEYGEGESKYDLGGLTWYARKKILTMREGIVRNIYTFGPTRAMKHFGLSPAKNKLVPVPFDGMLREHAKKIGTFASR